MMQDDFDPDEHEPKEEKTITIELSVEMYEFYGENGLIESRYFVVKNNFNDYWQHYTDAQSASESFWMDIATNIKKEIKDMWG